VLPASTAGALQVRQNLKAWLAQHTESKSMTNSNPATSRNNLSSFPTSFQDFDITNNILVQVSILPEHIPYLQRSKISQLPGNMSKREQVQLDTSLRRYGYDNSKPIILNSNLEIEDGWQRHRSCLRIQIAAIYVIFLGSSDMFVEMFNISETRRNLNVSQRTTKMGRAILMEIGLDHSRAMSDKAYWYAQDVPGRVEAWLKTARNTGRKNISHVGIISQGDESSSYIKGKHSFSRKTLKYFRDTHGVGKTETAALFTIFRYGGPVHLQRASRGESIRKIADGLKKEFLPAASRTIDTSDMFPANPVAEAAECVNNKIKTKKDMKEFLVLLTKSWGNLEKLMK
jgi:hypothetical protein